MQIGKIGVVDVNEYGAVALHQPVEQQRVKKIAQFLHRFRPGGDVQVLLFGRV